MPFTQIFSKVWLFVLAHFSHHVVTALVVPLLPYIRNNFGLDYTQSGLVVSAFSLSYGIAQLPAGWFADRVGARNLVTLSIVGVGVAGILVGISQTYLLLIIFLILMGIMGGGYHPAAPPLISAAVKSENRGFAMGLHIIGGSSSYFLSPLIGAAIAAAYGWRGAFIGLAMPTILFGSAFFFLVGHHTQARRPGAPAAADDAALAATPVPGRRIITFLVLTTLTSAFMVSVVSFIPLYMVDKFGVSERIAASFLAIVYATGFFAGPLGGYLSDRLGRVPMLLTVCCLSGPVVFLLNVVPYAAGFGTGALLFFFGIILIMRMPISEAFLVSEVPSRLRSTILGIYFFCAIEGGGVLTPVLGYAIDHIGLDLTFALAGGVQLLATLIAAPLLLKR